MLEYPAGGGICVPGVGFARRGGLTVRAWQIVGPARLTAFAGAALAHILILALCAPPAFAAQSMSEPLAKRTPSFSRAGSEGCIECHSGEFQRSISASPHGNEDKPATPMAGHGCESCHGPASFHVSRAHGGWGFPPLVNFGRGPGSSDRERQLEVCLDCHGSEGAGPLIGFIGSAHDRRVINCSTCHQSHAAEDPMSDPRRQAETCFRCHAAMKTDHPKFGNKQIDVSSRRCSVCHDIHEASGTRQ